MKYPVSSSALFPVAGLLFFPLTAQTQTRPNVVFIVVDDYGWADVGYNGSRFYETPNIDKLAADGVIFTDGYAAAPVSSPARVSIMTGKNPARTGITDWIPGYQYGLDKQKLSKYKMLSPEIPLNMPLEEVTIGEALREQGYKTFYVGKWHCAEDSLFYPQYQGFDVNIGGWLMGKPNGDVRKKGGRGAYFSPYHNPMLSDGPDGEYLTDRLGDECLKLMDSAGRSPFFLFLSFYAVHTPIEAKPEVTKYFEKKARKMGLDTISPFTTNKDWIRNTPYRAWHWKERTIQSDAEYAALIWSMDENVGKVLDYLKEEGLYDNTVILYASDHGSHFKTRNRDAHLNGYDDYKRSCHDGCLHVPLVICGGPFTGGKEVTDLVSTESIPKTLLALAGVDVGDKMIGENLLDVVEKKNHNRVNEVYAQISESRCGRCIRTENYMYSVYAPGINGGEAAASDVYADDFLYDMQKDPWQLNNVVADPAYANVKAELRERLLNWIQHTEGTRPTITD